MIVAISFAWSGKNNENGQNQNAPREGAGEELEYLILLLSIFAACTAIKLGYKLQLFNSKKHAALTLCSLFVIGSTLDSYAITRGYWNFQEQFFVGVTIGVMPVEEYLFVLVIPFLTIVIYRLASHAK